jgi:hypothetical protein
VSTWPEEELRKTAEADDLHIAPFREDGATYGTPTWVMIGARARSATVKVSPREITA